MIGLPIVTTIGWEYRVWKRKLYYDRNREHFPGSTPFYGKLWGYESDYMIETSLGEGDLVFWSVDPLSIHLSESLARFAYRHLKGDYDCWDFCGVVQKRDGVAVVVGPGGTYVRYSDLVADHRTCSLVVRTLIDTSPDGTERASISRMIPPITDVGLHLPMGFRVFADLSIKAIMKYIEGRSAVSLSKPVTNKPSPAISSLIHNANFPLSVLLGTDSDNRIAEIYEFFMDPLIFRNDQISYAPPFFVRRLDNEYYTHNRTKNIIVDWNLLQQRDQKNKLVTKHTQN